VAAHVTAAALSALAAAACWVAVRAVRRRMLLEPLHIDVTHHDVVCADLPAHLDGFTICQISDAHITAGGRNEQAIADAIRAVRADLFVFTGDMIYLRCGIPAFLQWLADLGDAARPALAVLGNAEHKSYLRSGEAAAALREHGLQVLCNQCARVPAGTGFLQVVGVDDPHTLRADFDRAYSDADPDAWTLLLCHSPDGVVDLRDHRADLMLCGHTHGGQVRLPGFQAPAQNTRRVRGLVAGWYDAREVARRTGLPEGRVRLYVSRGLGMSRFPGRLYCAPELPVFTLRAKRA